MEELFLICDCHSLEHQLLFWYDKDDNTLGVAVYLNSRGFWSRLKYGIAYIFGHKSNYGAWEEMLISDDNLKTLKEYLNNNVK